MKKLFVLMGIVAVAILVTDANAAAYRITTNMGGADAELREEAPTTNRGTSSELASRVSPYTTAVPPTYTQNSLSYLKFDVAGISEDDLLQNIMVQTSYRNNNLTVGRIQKPDTLEYTGFDYYVLDPTLEEANWDELAITPSNAPGYYLDGDYLTKGVGTPDTPTDGLTYLGRNLFKGYDLVGSPLHLPVGGAFNLICAPGSELHNAIVTAQELTLHKTVTIVMAIAHDQTCGYNNWCSFNYLFNPKEMVKLNTDTASPWSAMSNTYGQFSPALVITPEPATMILLGFGSLALLRKRK